MNKKELLRRNWAMGLLMLLAWLPMTVMAQSNQFEMVLEKTDGTEMAFRITDDYPVLQYHYGGEEGVNTLEIQAVEGTISVPCPDIKRLFTRTVTGIIPVIESEETTFNEAMNEETDLSDAVIDNTYYTMDAGNGDGYDATEQAIVLNSTVSEEQMEAVQDAKVGDESVRDNYSGIIFEVPAGSGIITVDVQTIGTHVLNVQIGKGEPAKVNKPERGTIELLYNVSEPTYVYLYATTGDGKALTRAAAENSVLLYGYSVTLDEKRKGDVNEDNNVNETDLQLVVDYIMNPYEDFNKAAADMDGDGDVNAADIVRIINVMTNQNKNIQ